MFRVVDMQRSDFFALMLCVIPDLAVANRLLYELRAERIEGYTAQTYPGLLAEIIKERRCELVWEGHRLFDARRLKVTMTREGKTISADDYRLTLPIPQAEIDANSGISESDQNYGY